MWDSQVQELPHSPDLNSNKLNVFAFWITGQKKKFDDILLKLFSDIL